MNYFEKSKRLYNERLNLFLTIEKIISHNYNIEPVYIRDTIKRRLAAESTNIDIKVSFVKSFALYYLVIGYFLIMSIIGKNNSVIKRDILYDMFGDNIFSRFYKKINTNLNTFQKEIIYDYSVTKKNLSRYLTSNTHSHIRQNKYFFEKNISKKIFLSEKNNFFVYFSLSKQYQMDVVLFLLKILKEIALHETYSIGLNALILLSANDNSFSALKYYIYKKNGIKNIMLIQNGARGVNVEQFCGDLYTYCDYYFAYGELSLKNQKGMHCKNKYATGSLLLSNQQSTINQYDLLFLEQFCMNEKDLNGFKNATFEVYQKILHNLVEFSNAHKDLKIIYMVNENKRGLKHSPSNWYAPFIPKIDEILEHGNILVDYGDKNSPYDLLLKSKLVVVYSSGIGAEAIGIDKNVLFLNYNQLDFIPHENENCVLTDDSFNAFEMKILNMLSLSREEHISLNTKVKENYMNFKDDVSDIITSIIYNLREEVSYE